MPHYPVQVAYNTTGVAGLVTEPQNWIEKVTPEQGKRCSASPVREMT